MTVDSTYDKGCLILTIKYNRDEHKTQSTSSAKAQTKLIFERKIFMISFGRELSKFEREI